MLLFRIETGYDKKLTLLKGEQVTLNIPGINEAITGKIIQVADDFCRATFPYNQAVADYIAHKGGTRKVA